jgi:hypothetical protein
VCHTSSRLASTQNIQLTYLHTQDLAAPAPPHLGAVLGASHFVGRMQMTRPTDMPASFDSAADLLHGLLEDLTADAPQVGTHCHCWRILATFSTRTPTVWFDQLGLH